MRYSLFFVLALAACAEPISNRCQPVECSTVSQPNNCGCVKHHSSNGTVRFNAASSIKTTQPEVRPSPPSSGGVTSEDGDGDHHNDGEVVI